MRSIGAVVLAAGGSSRFGRPKQLLKFEGKTLVRRAVKAAADALCEPVIVVVGEAGEAIREDLSGCSAVIVENLEWRRGLGTSIRCGLRKCVDSIDAVALLTCDQPRVDGTIVTRLVAAYRKEGKPIVASSYANTLGVPALFDRSCFDALLSLPDDAGAKSLIEGRLDDVGSVPFPEGAVDIDTPEDFQRLNADPG